MASPSAVAAADDAVQSTVDRLFRPFRFEHWIVLGFLSFLEQCGRMASSSCQLRLPMGDDKESDRAREILRTVLGWLSDHPLWAAGIAAVVLTFVMVGTVIVLWITSRGRFMYLDNVASGRADIRRPWSEHAGRAGSHFAWLLGLGVGAVIVLVTLMLPMAWAIVRLTKHGGRAAPIATVAVCGLLFLVVAIGTSLFMVALRDFVAPLQWYRDLSCGEAIRLFGTLFHAHRRLFVGYVLLKVVFSIVAVVLTAAVCCCCCCLMLPFLQQVVLQPILHFERRWSVEILKQLGHAPPVVEPPPAESREPLPTAAPLATEPVAPDTPPPDRDPDPDPGLPSL